MAARKETLDLVRLIRKAGGVVTMGRSGHFKVYLDGHLVTTLAVSSSDVRSIRNARSVLRKAGLNI